MAAGPSGHASALQNYQDTIAQRELAAA